MEFTELVTVHKNIKGLLNVNAKDKPPKELDKLTISELKHLYLYLDQGDYHKLHSQTKKQIIHNISVGNNMRGEYFKSHFGLTTISIPNLNLSYKLKIEYPHISVEKLEYDEEIETYRIKFSKNIFFDYKYFIESGWVRCIRSCLGKTQLVESHNDGLDVFNEYRSLFMFIELLHVYTQYKLICDTHNLPIELVKYTIFQFI